jgi:hypothetical protein
MTLAEVDLVAGADLRTIEVSAGETFALDGSRAETVFVGEFT